MNIQDLYAAIPTHRHVDVIIDGPRVYVKDNSGDMDEYFILSDGTLWPVPSAKWIGALRDALVHLHSDVHAIRTKLGI